jgi:hypothetical protein
MAGISKVEIDLTFERTIIDMGGQLVSALLPTKSPRHDNADFVFRDLNIICELKVLENDPNESGALDRKAQALFNEWMKQGRILIYGRRRIDSSTLPRDMQWELAKLHSESVKRVLKKANRQIRDTKVELPRFCRQEVKRFRELASLSTNVLSLFPPTRRIGLRWGAT